MRLRLTLAILGNRLPFNYHYCLSSAIYDIIRRSNADFSAFLHNQGYHIKRFKLFTFSDINVTFAPKGDYMLLSGGKAYLTICFHFPEAATHFLRGLFIGQTIVLRDRETAVRFNIENVQCDIPALIVGPDGLVSAMLEPISPLVSGRMPRDASKYRYHSPYEVVFCESLIFSWLQKYQAVSGLDDYAIEALQQQIRVEPIFFSNPPALRRVTIKQGQGSEQKLHGYTKFRLRVTAPKEMVELALSSGLGLKNSLGMGCVQLIGQ